MSNELKPVAYFLLNIDGTKDLVTVKEFENYCYGGGVMYAPEKEALYAIPKGYTLVPDNVLNDAVHLLCEYEKFGSIENEITPTLTAIFEAKETV